MNEIILLDIETTGFDPRKDEIVELGIVLLNLDTGEVKELYDQLFFVEEKYKGSWIFQNYIEFKDTQNKPNFQNCKEEINKVLLPFHGQITAWNRDFDSGFLRVNGIQLGKDLICPMKESADFFKLPNTSSYYSDFKWPKAQEAWDILFPNNPFTEEHRGLSDARMEAKIVYELHKRGIDVLSAVPEAWKADYTLVSYQREHAKGSLPSWEFYLYKLLEIGRTKELVYAEDNLEDITREDWEVIWEEYCSLGNLSVMDEEAAEYFNTEQNEGWWNEEELKNSLGKWCYHDYHEGIYPDEIISLWVCGRDMDYVNRWTDFSNWIKLDLLSTIIEERNSAPNRRYIDSIDKRFSITETLEIIKKLKIEASPND